MRAPVREKDLVYINKCFKVKKNNKQRAQQEKHIRNLNKLEAHRDRKLDEGYTASEVLDLYPTMRNALCKKVPFPTFDKLNQDLKKVTEAISRQDDEFGGVAFVVFKNQESVEKVVDFYGTNTNTRSFGRAFCSVITCGKKKHNPEKTSHGKRVFARQSPEPADLVWENLTLSFWHKFFFRVLTWTIMFALLAGSYFLNGVIYAWKKDVVKRGTESEDLMDNI